MEISDCRFPRLRRPNQNREPRPKGEVLEEGELTIFVQLAVFHTLALDLLPNHAFISVLVNRTCEVAI